MKVLEMILDQSAVALYELKQRSADDYHHHGSLYQISIPLIGNPLMAFYGEEKRLDGRAVTSVGEEHRNFSNDETIRLLIISIQKEFIQRIYTEQTGDSAEIEFERWGENSSESFKKLAEKAFKTRLDINVDVNELQSLEIEFATQLLTLQKGSHSSRWSKVKHSFDHPIFMRILDYINEHYQEKIGLEELVVISKLSKVHINRLFQEILGVTPAKYIMNLRIERAKAELLTTNKDITSIAYDCGFGSLSSFERSFKQVYKCSPKEYKGKA